MNIDAALLRQGLQRGKAAAGAGLFTRLCRGKKADDLCSVPPLTPCTAFIMDAAEQYRRSAIPALSYSLFKCYDTSGNRLLYEAVFFERRKQLLALALASWLRGRPEDISALEDRIWAICDEYSWCLPAHMEGTSLSPQQGDPGPRPEKIDNSLRLDLFACETGFALAECCAMLENLLSPAVTARARSEVKRRVLKSYMTHGRLWNWELMENNWCAVCAGSIGGAAMYLVEDDTILTEIFHRLFPVLERYINSFSPDGACAEGLSYWTYGLSFYVAFCDLLLLRTDGAINLLEDPRFAPIARFQQQCYFHGGGILRFSDADDDNAFRPGLICYLADRVKGVLVPRFPFMENKGARLIDNCGRFAPALRDLLWTHDKVPLTDDAARRSIFPHAQWFLCSGNDETGFAAKGGHNGEPHNHNDVGNFIYYKKGRMVLCDLGAGEYTKEYFGDKRYTILCNRSEGHNVPLVNGQGQRTGREFGAADCRFVSANEDEGVMILDIAPAYQARGLKRLERYFCFDLSGGALTLRDTVEFDGKPLPFTERFITLCKPSIESGKVLIDTGSTRCFLESSEKKEPVVRKLEHRDHDGRTVLVYAIDFLFKPGETKFFAEFTLR
jgi:hypothetical protein